MIKRVIKRVLARVKFRNVRSYFSTDISLKSKFEGLNYIGRNCCFEGEMQLGSYISDNSVIFGKIGRFTSVASGVTVVIGVHPYTYPLSLRRLCSSPNPNTAQRHLPDASCLRSIGTPKEGSP